jgi:peptidoglycan/xylan/chitin deacetylase (PgdA/CDA1 family)
LKLNWYKKRDLATKKILVLMYHRIADIDRDPWQLAVTPEHFEQSLTLLQKKFNVITVSELVEQLNNKSITSDSVCLTFDDGYADNFHIAKPLLEKYSCPATFFIPSQNLIQHSPFWWDELEAIIFNEEHLPTRFSQIINGHQIACGLGHESSLTERLVKKQNRWKWPEKPLTKRCRLYLRIWEALKPLPYPELEIELAKIKTWASIKEASKSEPLPMTMEQLQVLSSHPLFEIGMHTVSHPALSSHPYEIQLREILENKNTLEHYCNRPINTIAFPYGDHNNVTLDIVRNLALAAAFSTKESSVTNESQRINLGRFQVNDWKGEKFEKLLFKWIRAK